VAAAPLVASDQSPPRGEKNGDACGAAKFREETSKKQTAGSRDRVAAVHNVAAAGWGGQARIAAVQH
jgi:hypothetical protein